MMGHRDLVAIGTSAGGVAALRFLASRLPRDFPAAILAVIHIQSGWRSSLDTILTHAGPLPVAFARDGDEIVPGRIYIGPPDTHLLVSHNGERLALGHGPHENNARPAIDPLFRSIAVCCGLRAIGVILTGALGDGASGLRALKTCGALTVVQDPNDAAVSDMPNAALSQVHPDHVVGLGAMPALLDKLAREPAGAPVSVPDQIKFEVEIARTGATSMSDMDRAGRRSLLTCPDCHGVMWEVDDGELVRYRCHTGHAYAAELLNLALDESIRRSMASALRALEERIALTRRLKADAERRGHDRVAQSWERRLDEIQSEADVLRTSMQRMTKLAAAAAQGDEPPKIRRMAR